MAKSLRDAIAQVQKYALSVEGVAAAPDEPQEAINAYPFAVTYPASGLLTTETAGQRREIHTIFTEIHINPVILESAIDLAKTILEDLSLLLEQNPTLDGTVDNIVPPGIRYTFGRLEWAGTVDIGFRFEIDVKIRGEL